uniref:Uncharacterized protein n=1 Tax=Arundo donax TaxID=35708 RepID=A0A0A9CF36_ARUDO
MLGMFYFIAKTCKHVSISKNQTRIQVRLQSSESLKAKVQAPTQLPPKQIQEVCEYQCTLD